MKSFILIVFVLISAYSNAQVSYFNKKYDTRGNNDFATAIETIDSGYVIFGASVNANINSQGLFLLFLDKNGDSIYSKWYGEINSFYGPCWGGGFRKANTSGFYSAIGLEESNGDQYGVLIRFDNNGDTLWKKKYRSGGNNTLFYHARQTVDDGFICAGIKTIGSNDQGVLIKTDSLGNIEWEQTYGGGGQEYGTMVLPFSGGGYFLGGDTKSIPCSSGETDQWLVKTNSAGIQQWQKCYGTMDDEGNALPGYEFANGDIVYVGQWAYNSIKWYPFLARIDTNGDTVWTKKMGPFGVTGFLRNMMVSSGEDILAIGKWQWTTGSQGLFVRASPNGDSLWYRKYDYDPSTFNNEELWDIDTAHGEGNVMVGTTNLGGFLDIWVIKVDSHGCLFDPDCWLPEVYEEDKYSVGMNELEKENYFSIYPNPNNGKFFIENKVGIKSDMEIKIYNPLGEILFSTMFINTKTEIDLTEFSNGIYFIEVIGDGIMWREKIVKE